MTEYIGWDNYVKEHGMKFKQQVRDWAESVNALHETRITDIEEKVKKWTDWCQHHPALREETEELRKKVKDLEEKHKIYHGNEALQLTDSDIWRYLTCIDAHHDRITKIEEWKSRHIDIDTDSLNHLWDKVKDLGNNTNDQLNIMYRRIEDLEEWKDSHNKFILTPHHRTDERLKALEEWKKEIKDWKEWTVYSRFSNFEQICNRDASRIDKLEEWKQQVLNDFDLVRKLTNQIVVDKKVWEEIKSATAYINSHGTISGWQLQPGKILTEALKKADPSWCD